MSGKYQNNLQIPKSNDGDTNGSLKIHLYIEVLIVSVCKYK